MDFEFNEDQKIFRESLRAFLDKEIAPIVDERDRKGPLTREETIGFMKKFKKLGIGFDPESLKEIVQDFMIYGIFTEEIFRVWPSLGATLGMNLGTAFVPFSSEAMREKLLPRLEAAELTSCQGITEPSHGSDSSILDTKAVLDGNEYVINGQKTWISNAPIADLCLLVAMDAETNMQSFFLVDKEESPFEVTELHKIGWKAFPTGELFFDDCRIPKENNLMNVIGEMLSGGGAEKLLKEFELPPDFGMLNLFGMMSPVSALFCFARSGMALGATGICQAALEDSIKYAKEREQFGRPIGKNQLIQNMIYEMSALTDTSRLLSYRALDLCRRGDPDVRRASSLAKCYTSEAVVKVTYDTIQIYGGAGLSEDYPLERYFRDARMFSIPDGTSEIQKLVVGREVLGMSAYK
jgi:hypothetical protein